MPSHQALQQVALAEASPSAWRPLLAQFLAQVQQPHPAATHSAEVGPSSVPTALPSAVQLPLVVLVCSPSGELRSSAQLEAVLAAFSLESPLVRSEVLVL